MLTTRKIIGLAAATIVAGTLAAGAANAAPSTGNLNPAEVAAKSDVTTVSLRYRRGGYRIKRAPKVTMHALKHLRVLKCLKTSGDVVAQPFVINTTGQILPIGRKIYWRAKLVNGAIYNGTHTLTTPLYAGQGRRISATLHWRFTCTAMVFV